MRKTRWIFAGLCAGLSLLAASPTWAVDGEGLVANPDQAAWARWQGRVAYDSGAPVWRSGLGGFESGGFNAKRAGSVGSLSLMGDYYFARSLSLGSGTGGFRATSGIVVGPRSQVSLGQPGWSAVGNPSLGSRVFGPSAIPYTSDPYNDTATLPYLGLGYTGLSSHGGWSFSADLGMLGQTAGSAANRLFGTGQRAMDDGGHDLRLMPLLQVGVLYSF